MRTLLVALGVIWSAITLAQESAGQGQEVVYTGTVVFGATAIPAAGVRVEVIKWKYKWGALLHAPMSVLMDADAVFTASAVTGANGEFRIVAPDKASELWAQMPGYYVGFDLDRKHARRSFEVRMRPLVSEAIRGSDVNSEAIRQIKWSLRNDMRDVVARLIEHRDSNSLSGFLSLQAYLDQAIISEKEFLRFRQYRASLTDPCDTEPEFRIVWQRMNFFFDSTDTPLQFITERCFRTSFDAGTVR